MPSGLRPFFCAALRAHHHARRRAVGELARVARGDDSAGKRGIDLRHAFVGRVGADALVGGDRHFLGEEPPRILVGHAHESRHGHDLVVELAGRQRRGGALLAARAVFVLLFARDVVALGDGFRGLQHAPVDLGLVLREPALGEHVVVHLVLHARDRFHAARHHHVALARGDALRGERDRLQARGAEAVHGHARHRHRAARAQRASGGRCCRRWRPRAWRSPGSRPRPRADRCRRARSRP